MYARASSPRFLPLAAGERCMHGFLAACTVVIVTTLMMPRVFGFQDFRQWAGMYVDNWCQITACSGPPGTSDVACEHNAVGMMGLSVPVWTMPSHNESSCAHWAKEMACGRTAGGGWTITNVRPSFKKGGYFLGQANVCDADLGSTFPWFTYADAK